MCKKGLFIGLTTVDIQYFVNAFPERNIKIKADQPLLTAGGPAANAAVAFSVLGGSADFISCIGRHAFTSLVISDLESVGVSVIDILGDRQNDPVMATVLTSLDNGDRTIITHHPYTISVSEKKQIDIQAYDFVFTDGFYPEIAEKYCIDAREAGIPVIFDGGSWKPHLFDFLSLIDIAICSENFYPPASSTLNDLFEFFDKNFSCKVAVSRGEKPIVGTDFEIEVDSRGIIDTLAAGDFLHGAFCYYYSLNANFKKALSDASHVASFSAKYKGTREWIRHLNKILA